jgi:hypothetical protein
MNINKEYNKLIKTQLVLADEFALGFYHWMLRNDTMENAEKWFGYSDEDMLEEYKRELLSLNLNVYGGDEQMMNPGIKRKDKDNSKIG